MIKPTVVLAYRFAQTSCSTQLYLVNPPNSLDEVIYLSIAPMMFFASIESAFRIFSPRLEAWLTTVGPGWKFADFPAGITQLVYRRMADYPTRRSRILLLLGFLIESGSMVTQPEIRFKAVNKITAGQYPFVTMCSAMKPSELPLTTL
jgi:hypothetical protein